MSRTVGMLVLCVMAVGLTGCNACCPREVAAPPARTFDRASERKAVLEAVLEHGHGKGRERFLVNPVMGPASMFAVQYEELVPADARARWREEPKVAVPGGGFVPAPEIPGLFAATLEDWAARARDVPVPRDLRLSLPVVWLARNEWKDWADFRRRFGADAAWLHLSDVGFSPGGEQALVLAAWESGDEAGAGYWFLLRREPAGWRVVETLMAWIS